MLYTGNINIDNPLQGTNEINDGYVGTKQFYHRDKGIWYADFDVINTKTPFRTTLGLEIIVNANSIYSTSYNKNEALILQDTAMCAYKFSGCGADGRFYEQYYSWLELNAGDQFPDSTDIAQGTMIIQII